MQYILHSQNSKLSRDFLESNKLDDYELIDWDNSDVEMLLAQGLPSPRSFPSAVYLLTPAAGEKDTQFPDDNSSTESFDYPASWVLIDEPKDLSDAEIKRDEAQAQKDRGQFMGTPVPTIPDVAGFVGLILSDPRTQALEVFKGMVDGLDKLQSYSGKTTPQFMQLYWSGIKHDLKLSPEYIQFVEDTAQACNIPLVGEKNG